MSMTTSELPKTALLDKQGEASEPLKSDANSTFEPSNSWKGAKPGWVFKKGSLGLGYYVDMPPKRYHDIFDKLKHNAMDEVLRFKDGWNERDQDGSTVLHWGALLGSLEVVNKALDMGLEVDVRAENKQTPLFWAVTRGQVKTVKALLARGADMFAKDSLGASPPLIAIQFKQATVLLYLLANEKIRSQVLATVDSKGCTLSHWAAYVGDMAGLKILEHYRADIAGARDNDGKTALHRSVSQNFNRDIIEFLLDQQVNPYVKDSNGKTFLDIAGDQHGRPQVEAALAKIFKERNINPGCVDHGDGSSMDLESSMPKKASKGTSNGKSDFEKLMKWGPAIFWLACVSLTTFEYLIDIRDHCWTNRPMSAFLFELGVPASLILFVAVAFTDPGIIKPRPKELAIEEVTRGFESGTLDYAPKLCSETWVVKPPRSKYCRETGRCIEEFDHFCGWLNCAIGKNNHRQFMVLAIVEVSTQLLYLYLGFTAAVELQPLGNSYTEWFLALAAFYPLLVMNLMIQFFTALLILNLVKFQGTLVCWNYTANEFINAERYGFTEVAASGKRELRVSPFNKGSSSANCMDFWYIRRRSVGVNVD
mmetsp:Transcript_15099/g.32534  ORF Transcript_15099/g.32534 Transcript_15099/m.32534 type:complete len:593 (+) Transcript_15099:460-2238(+)|eukprot:CAMPEP_0206436974 /NCGR_PEP_ID=MMETSP0324_2-20121206/10781_1 /ASSEMBLY_ACC=CAM_ASM_000836 /TAXON_ID=2866 /ORGANISM="Crypthecodinium cohnii, Strain Seligo" /LENGTH=592 /DNA_ID=CAMNT_0053904199 /DNA_START=372 /DNA_END=2150 /DNA_ORIENTATION=-